MSLEAKLTSNKRLSRKSAKVQNYVEDSKSDDESPMKKGRTSRENTIHAEGNEKNSTDSDDKEAEDLPSK